jgi:predicted NAD/FAD-binding protein
VAAAFASLLSHAQRTLSTQVREIRRRTAEVTGRIVHVDGKTTPLDADVLTAVPERALRILCAAVIALAVALVLARVT